MPAAPPAFLPALQSFTTRVTAAFAASTAVGAQPEVQLLAPLTELLHGFAGTQALAEVQLPGIGRPDLGVLSGGLLTGHVELKAPGKGGRRGRRAVWVRAAGPPPPDEPTTDLDANAIQGLEGCASILNLLTANN